MADEATARRDGEAGAARGGALATVFFTVAGNAFLVLGTLACGLLAILVAPLPPRGDWVFRVARLWSRGLLLASGVAVDAVYDAPLDRRTGYVFLANHQSIIDVPVLITTVPGQARFLAKRSLFRIPIFGWAIRAGGFVPVDRADREAARRTFQVAGRRLAAGKSLVIFPEETRSADGALGPFKRGGPLLAQKVEAPVVPVGIVGTLRVRPKGVHVVRPTRVRVRFGAPIPAAELAGRGAAAVADDVRGRVASLLA